MRIGVVGATGTLGRALLTRWARPEPDIRLRALVRRPDQALERFAECVVSTDGVLGRDALARFVHDCDVVINLAARNPKGQDRDLFEVRDFMTVNGLGAALVAAECATLRIPLLHFSTVAVYELHAYQEAIELDEDCVLPNLDQRSVAYFRSALAGAQDAARANAGRFEHFLELIDAADYPPQASVYGLSKLVGERAVVESGVRSCCLRLSDVFGPGHESRGVVVDHITGLRSSKTIDVDLDFRASAYLIDIDDALAATRELAMRLGRGSPLPPIVNLVGHRLDEPALAAALERLADSQGISNTFSIPPPSHRTKFDRRYASSRLHSILPNFALTPFDQSLARTWAAFEGLS